MGNRILIVEDDAAIVQSLRLNLECSGYTVTSFDNGLTLWNSLEQEHNYDLALLDMMLPGVDGFSLLPKLREYDIPVICLTAMGDAHHEVQGLRGGAEDYIAKPFDMLALLAQISSPSFGPIPFRENSRFFVRFSRSSVRSIPIFFRAVYARWLISSS